MDTPSIPIQGSLLDDQSRCTHWHSPLDIVAIKFACCGEFYACYQCHQEAAGHVPRRWPKASFATESAILCGACRSALTIAQYMRGDPACPNCQAPFNPRCALHWTLYFELD